MTTQLQLINTITIIIVWNCPEGLMHSSFSVSDSTFSTSLHLPPHYGTVNISAGITETTGTQLKYYSPSHTKADLHTNLRWCEHSIRVRSVRMLLGQMASYSEWVKYLVISSRCVAVCCFFRVCWQLTFHRRNVCVLCKDSVRTAQ